MSVAMLDWAQRPAVERVPGKVISAWVFKATRVPVRALFENLEDGVTVNDFLTWFPGVTREQLHAVLEHAERSLAVAGARNGPRGDENRFRPIHFRCLRFRHPRTVKREQECAKDNYRSGAPAGNTGRAFNARRVHNRAKAEWQGF
jgi:uncharacterized protein (DUF433 family)